MAFMTQLWLLLITLLVLLNIVFGSSLVCFKTPNCNCSIDYNGELQFKCGLQLGMSMTMSLRPANAAQVAQDNGYIKIFCSGNNVSRQWPDLLKGLNVSGSYKYLEIERCPIPDQSIKWILEQFIVDKVKIVVFSYIPNHNDTFQPYHFEKLDFLENLKIMFSGITTLPQSVFSGTPNLKYLYLNNNKLIRVPVGLFQPLSKLLFLDLGKNNLTDLEPEVFKHLPQLSYLNIYGNNLKNLSRQTFSYFRNLTSLDVSSNGITTLPKNLFQNLSTLTELNMRFNNISILPENMFSNMTLLKKIYTDYSFSKTFVDVPSGLFSNLISLKDLSMNSNNLTYLPENMFRNSAQIRNVSLNTNRLTQLPNSLFQDCKNLQKVDLGSNKLTVLNVTLFHGLKNLKELRLNNNQISFINE